MRHPAQFASVFHASPEPVFLRCADAAAASSDCLALASILSMMPAASKPADFIGYRPARMLLRFLGAGAPVAELVDAPDSKSGGFTSVLLRVRPGAPPLLQRKQLFMQGSAWPWQRPAVQP